MTMFPDNTEQMAIINSILDKCLVDRPQKCLQSAGKLLEVVDEKLAMMEQGVPSANSAGQLLLPCRVCAKGHYLDKTSNSFLNLAISDQYNVRTLEMKLRTLVCNVCTHTIFFAPGYPQEAAKRGWTPWQGS